MTHPKVHAVLAAVLAALLTAACSTVPPAPAPEARPAAADPDTVLLEAETALQQRRYRAAAEAYAAAAGFTDDEAVIGQAAQVAFEAQQPSLVARIAKRWLEVNPTSEQALRYAGFAALDLYQLDEAIEHFDVLLTSAFISAGAGFLGLEPQLSENGSPAAVTTVLRGLVARHPDVAEGHHALAQAALRSENVALALESAEKARALSPYWSPAAMLLARIYLVVDRIDEGLAIATRTLEQDPQLANRLERALLLIAADRRDEGRAELAQMAEAADDTALVAERVLAIDDFESGRYDQAAARFRRLMERGAFVFESSFFLGGLAEQRQEPEEARRNYARVVQGTYAVNAQVRIARLLKERVDADAALAWLARFAEERPQYAVEMIAARSRLMEEDGDVAGARKLLDDGLRTYPDAHDLSLARGYLNERDGELQAAIADLTTLQQRRPADPVILNALGYLLIDRTRRHEEGFALIQQAHDQTPDSGPVLDSMGWALHRLGRNEEALKYLEEARTRVYDPEIELHVGDVLWALGRRDEARSTWQAGRDRHPDEEAFAQRLQRRR